MNRSGETVRCRFWSPTALEGAALTFTTDSGAWQKRQWHAVPARIDDGIIEATLPAERPLVYYFAVTDDRGLRCSSEHEELPR